MGLLDTGADSVPALGLGDGPRETYVPKPVLRRTDFPEPKRTVRDELLSCLRARPRSWSELTADLPQIQASALAVQLSVLIRESIIEIDAHGNYAPMPESARTAGRGLDGNPPSDRAQDGHAHLEIENELKHLLVSLAQRALEFEARQEALAKAALADADAERQLRRAMEAKLLAAAVR
ncbi:hypothetical protein [Acidithiobacillus caldus]|uniref:hypothetical protein n=1 Tax=Acidithiobacillus caldus TaxID=33059 RepID=UPI0003141A41|nr:hypothetical protein [Acidithiobacillus caldus]